MILYILLFLIILVIIIWGGVTQWRFYSNSKLYFNQKIELPYFHGEFGHELDRAIPYAYFLYKENRLKSIECLKGMKEFYKVFPSNIVKYKDNRKRCGMISQNWHKYIGSDNHSYPISFDWKPPQYTGLYKNIPIIYPSDNKINNPKLIIHNKYTSEWGGKPVNFIPPKTIRELNRKFSDKFSIIIIHPKLNEKGFTSDHQNMEEGGNFDYSGMLTIQELLKLNPKLDYNTIQLALHDNCKNFISVQGGSSRIASLFGGNNIVLHIKGSENDNEYQNILGKLSPVNIHVVNNPKKLVEKALFLFK